MAYDEQLAERVRQVLGDRPATERRMFGGLAFLVGGNLAVAVSSHGGLMVRIEPDMLDVLLGEPGTDLVTMGRRSPLTGWLRVTSDAVADDDGLGRWVQRGVSYASTLPAK